MRAIACAALLAACTPVELISSSIGQPCGEDADCGVAALCIGDICHACPSLDGCVVPEPAPKWTRLQRNGCPVCEFAPAAECYGASDCDETCYRGARCATGCARFECCANVCEPDGCEPLAPLGCAATCPVGMTCTACVATLCRCSPEGWTCDVGCGDLSPACSYTPP